MTAKAQYNLKNAEQYFGEHLSVGDYYDEGQKTCGEWIGHGMVGSVPDLKAAVTTRFVGQFGVATPPLVSSICTIETPGGTAKSTFVWVFATCSM